MPSKRRAKKMCKTYMRESGLVHIRTIRRLFIVEPRHGFLCSRWYGFTIAAANHDNLQALIDEQK